jgi:hydrogenase nickel incorporation protein HypB
MTDQVKLIEVKEDVLADNTKVAGDLRKELKAKGTFLLNLMASPGAGKTSTVLATAERLKNKLKMGVMEADIDSMVDAEKVAAAGVEAIQIRTGGFCHMDATMVKEGLDAIQYENFDLIILENVGNLVCPAEFDTGSIRNAMILSVPEGDDKPLKYPLMFSVCDVLLVNKIDYMSLSDFDFELMKKRVLHINPKIQIFEISCKTEEGIDNWTNWLESEVQNFQKS